jgi:hypothetical protein
MRVVPLAAGLLLLPLSGHAWSKVVPGYTKCARVVVKGGAKAKVAVRHVPCSTGRAVAQGYYDVVGGKPDGHTSDGSIYYRVQGFRCTTGLGGSEGFCSHRDQKVLLSTRSDDGFPY